MLLNFSDLTGTSRSGGGFEAINMSDVARVCYLCGGVPEAPYGRLDVSLRDAVEGVLGRAVPSLAVDDDDDDNDDDDPSPCCKTCLGLAEELDRLRRRLREVEEQIRRRDKRKILHAKLKEPYRREGEAGMVDRRHFEMTLKEFVAAGMCQYCCQSTSVSTEEEEDQRLAAVVHKCRGSFLLFPLPLPPRPDGL